MSVRREGDQAALGVQQAEIVAQRVVEDADWVRFPNGNGKRVDLE